MTETTEEDPFEKAKTHICGLPGFSEYCDYIRARKGHQPPTNDFLSAISKHITSLTEERDELKAEVDDLNYRAEEDERTIINHEKEMDALESQLSNREKEIKELKDELNKPADDILYYHDNPRTPHCDVFWSVNEWPTSRVGLVNRYSVRNIAPIWCVRTYYSYRTFDNEQDAIEYSNTFECKGFRTEQDYLASLQSKEGEE